MWQGEPKKPTGYAKTAGFSPGFKVSSVGHWSPGLAQVLVPLVVPDFKFNIVCEDNSAIGNCLQLCKVKSVWNKSVCPVCWQVLPSLHSSIRPSIYLSTHSRGSASLWLGKVALVTWRRKYLEGVIMGRRESIQEKFLFCASSSRSFGLLSPLTQ